MLKVQVAEHGVALEQARPVRCLQLPFQVLAQAEIARVTRTVTDQDTVRQRTPHGRMPGDTPIGCTAHRRLFAFGERPRQARATDQREHLAAEKAEPGDERIGGE